MPAMAQQSGPGSASARPLITQKINPAAVAPVRGNVRTDLAAHKDLGPVDGSLKLNHVMIVLQRSPEQQGDLEAFLQRQQQPGSPEYHQWLTPEQFGERFGVAAADIAKITTWLEQQGITVNTVEHSNMFVDMSVTASQLRDVFGADLHYFQVNGRQHFANVTAPQLPVALNSVAVGLAGLNDFPRKPMHTAPAQASNFKASFATAHPKLAAALKGQYNDASGGLAVGPQDFYTIYNVNPVYTAGTKGANATIAVAEQSDMEFGTVNTSTGAATGGDVVTFRNLFGANAVSSTLNMYVYHGYGSVKCNAPGIDPENVQEDVEASLDAEWASAVAPAAKLIFMSCDQSPDDGVITAITALIDNNLSDVISMSYGESELGLDATDFSQLDALWTQAAAQGQTIIISAGDSGSDSNDQNSPYAATSGINVNGFAASPYVLAAGGTDFQDEYDAALNNTNTIPYWNDTNNSYYGSANQYVPETAWNDSCASSIIANYFYLEYGDPSDPAQFCDSYDATYNSLVAGEIVGGSGGVSSHYSLPTYQSGITGLPATKFRGQPDVSFFAADGIWGHYLLFCDSHYATQTQDFSCSQPSQGDFGGAGGTSFVAPQLAGVTGLLVSKTGERQGTLNYGIYALAKSQFTGSSTKSACYANGQTNNVGTTTGTPAASCTFHDVTTSNNDVGCQAGTPNCYTNFSYYGDYGVLSTSNTTEAIAYNSGAGYDLATGIGTMNVNNFLNNWKSINTTATAIKASATSISTTGSTVLTATVTPGGGAGSAGTAATGTITFKDTTKNTTLGTCTLTKDTCTLTVSAGSLNTGANSITASYGGSNTYPSSTSSAVTVTVTTTATTTITLSGSPGTSFPVGTDATGVATIKASSGTPNAGTVTFYANGTTLATENVSNGTATLHFNTAGYAATGYSITATYSGTTGFSGSTSAALEVTLTKASSKTTLSAASTTVTPPASDTLTASITGGSAGTVTGTVTFSVEGVVLSTVNVSGGKAVLNASTSGVQPGTYPVTATYNGNSYYSSSVSAPVNITVK